MATVTLGAVAAHFGRDVDRGVSKVVGIVESAARDGVAAAVRAALAQADRNAYQDRPEKVDQFWTEAETWGDE